MNRQQNIAAIGSFVLLTLLSSTACVANGQQQSELLPDLLQLRRGLTIVLGADADLAADLHSRTQLPVQCLALDDAEVKKTRLNLIERGLYGPVTVALWREREYLPYADNLVSLMLAPRAAEWQEAGLTTEEMLRVMAPYGTLALRDPEGVPPGTEAQPLNGWVIHTKPYPDEMDGWPQYGYNTTGSMVSRDRVAGPVRSLRWQDGPVWQNRWSGTMLMVSGGGQMYLLAGEWSIEARNAFSGFPLWQRRVSRLDVRSEPPLPIAVGDRVYVPVPENDGNYVALDGASGEILQRYEFTGAGVKYHEGVFLVASGEEQQAWDADTGEMLWSIPVGELPGRVAQRFWSATAQHMQLMIDDRMYVIDNQDAELRMRRGEEDIETGTLICRGLRDGEVRWRAPLQTNSERLTAVTGDRVLTMRHNGSTEKTLSAYSSDNGEHVWSYDFLMYSHKGLGVQWALVDDRIYMPISSGSSGWTDRMNTVLVGLDTVTGEKIREWPSPRGADSVVRRCFGAHSTERYLMYQGGIMHDLSLEKQPEDGATRAMRGMCGVGYLPANGLIYSGPDSCGCVNPIRGWTAFGSEYTLPDDPQTLLIRGPAYGTTGEGAAAGDGDWPIHRGNPLRHGSSVVDAPPELLDAWTAALSGRPSAPVVAGGSVYLAVPERHRISAMDAGSGEIRWNFTAEGRVDSPPTYWRGMLLFGCRDGWLYALNAVDGELAWRLRVAPADRRIVYRGALESSWPLHGSVLVQDGIAYVVSGRHTELDGGLMFHAVEPISGDVLWSERFDRSHPGGVMNRRFATSTPTLLQSDGEYLYMHHDLTLDLKDGSFDPERARGLHGGGGGHRRPATDSKILWCGLLGFLDEEVMIGGGFGFATARKYWDYAGRLAQLFVLRDDGSYFGVLHRGGSRERDWVSGLERYPGWQNADNGPVPGAVVFGSIDDGAAWQKSVNADDDLRIMALAAAGERLYAAVAPDRNDAGRGEIWVLSAADGKRLATHNIAGRPRFDGIAVTDTGIFVATDAGNVIHLAGR